MKLLLALLFSLFSISAQASSVTGGGGEVGNGGDGLPYLFQNAATELAGRLENLGTLQTGQELSPLTSQFLKENQDALLKNIKTARVVWENSPDSTACALPITDQNFTFNLAGCRDYDFEAAIQALLAADISLFKKSEMESLQLTKEISALLAGAFQNVVIACYPDLDGGIYQASLTRDQAGNMNLFWFQKGFYSSRVFGYAFGGITTSPVKNSFGTSGTRYSFTESDSANFSGNLEVSTLEINSSHLVRAILTVDTCQASGCPGQRRDWMMNCKVQ